MNNLSTEKIRLIILDLDGTIADTLESIREGVNMAMNKYGYPPRSYEQVRAAVGNGARELIRRSMPAEAADDEALVTRVFDDYDIFYGETYHHCTECYGGIPEALATLLERGYTLAVLSNKQDTYVKKLITQLLPEGTVKIAMGQTELPKKPDPTVPLMIANELGFDARQTAFVGDSEVDIRTAQNSKMLSVGCSWGFREKEVLLRSGADIIIDTPTELTHIFK